MKMLMGFILITLSFNVLACPELQGKYHKCSSDVQAIEGEYIVDQHQESDYEVYDIEYFNSVTGESIKDQIKTNSENMIKKETLPKVGMTVKINAKTHCDDNVVVSEGDAYVLGAKVGVFTTKIFREGNSLKSYLDGVYLGSEVHKLIVCEIE